MNTLTKLALGVLGKLTPLPPSGDPAELRALPAPALSGGMPLMAALAQRQSQREFAPDALPDQVLSELLWAAGGINRPGLGGRTAPSAMNSQEVQLYVALPQGLFLYEPVRHALQLAAAGDVRRVTGNQDFVDKAPLDLIFVADHTRMKLVPASQRQPYAFAAAGAMAQNVYLYCASAGLATVIRAWFDHQALSRAMGLQADHQLLLSQTVGRVPAAAPA
ncbi:MAG TPA: SagB/ThcOx family dehydrogenase [Burkholderiaceae bacterium]|nr:SagB/ThcOx family dehydrogenase [Burkholderiaceae bacterium]